MEPKAEATLAIRRLADSLEQRFAELEPWLGLEDHLWRARPGTGAWSVGEIVEHLSLCQRYLLQLVDKIAARSMRRLAEGAAIPERASDLSVLDALALHSFSWPHPAHMTPSGAIGRRELAGELELQRTRCLEHLRRLPAGEGALHSLRMSVVGRRLDLYQYMKLIDLHLARHLGQMERTLAALTEQQPSGPKPARDPPGP